MYRIINVSGSDKDKNFNEPREFDLPGKSWIDFYRQTVLDKNDKLYLCSVHNCNNQGSHGGHVAVYHSINKIHTFECYGIVPLCRSHNGQRHMLRSGVNDEIINEGRGFGLVLMKKCKIALLDYRFIP